jgi:hypothetical protein
MTATSALKDTEGTPLPECGKQSQMDKVSVALKRTCLGILGLMALACSGGSNSPGPQGAAPAIASNPTDLTVKAMRSFLTTRRYKTPHSIASIASARLCSSAYDSAGSDPLRQGRLPKRSRDTTSPTGRRVVGP